MVWKEYSCSCGLPFKGSLILVFKKSFKLVVKGGRKKVGRRAVVGWLVGWLEDWFHMVHI